MPTYPSVTLTLTDKLNLHYTEYGDRRLAAQAWPRNPLVNWFLSKAKPYQGGVYISEAIEDGYTPTGGAIVEGSTLTRSQQNYSYPAQYRIKVLQEGVYLDRFRLLEVDTKGPMGPIVMLAEAAQRSTINKIRENLALQLCAQTTSGNNVTSLFDVIKTTGTLGGVDPTQFSYWASSGDYNVGAWSSNGVSKTRTMLRETRRYTGFSGPDAMFASKTTIDAMKAGGYTKTTFFRDPNKAVGYDVGDGPKFQADTPDCEFDNIPVWYDPHLDALEAAGVDASHPGGVLVGINSEAVYFKISGTPFALDTENGGPWKADPTKWGIYADSFFKGNLVAKNRNSCFVLGGIT